MYPNPQDVLPLPPRPDRTQYARLAKELSRACRSGVDSEYRAWCERFTRRLREHGSVTAAPAETERVDAELERFARERMRGAACALTQAQFVIARAHGFASWARLSEQLDRLAGGTDAFESAADAVVSGDVAGLQRLIAADPALVRMRSAREHRATLLHYVSANGIENYRQKTPSNIVEIAQLLLDSGAEIDADADVYGGGATALSLVVTSAHPRAAGVQLALADLLLSRGARVDAGIVRSCLANGCPEAAAHMAQHVSSVDLEEAAGLGLVDTVAALYAGSETARVPALLMACWYDRAAVVELLLERGVPASSPAPDDARTALHLASYLGNVALVDLLLRHGAAVDAVDATHRTTPLVWALHGWLVEQRSGSHRAVLLRLADAGATVRRDWIADDRVRSDAELYARLLERAGD